jgi:RHS repeat-associated protein
VLLNQVLDVTKNNGNLQSQTISAQALNFTQTYEYNELNRLKSISDSGGISQTYAYDRWGNRAVIAGYVQTPSKIPTPTALTDFNPNNRIKAYDDDDNNWNDASGNLKEVPGHQFTYDAENKMISHDDIVGTVNLADDYYSYDGEGRRVKKVNGTVSTIFVYNILGQVVAEYSDSAPSSNGTSYFTTDHLGSPRIITNAQGSVISRHDYLPFGEEIKAQTGNRTIAQGYLGDADGVRQKFTQYERDLETELDFAQARYYASAQGRFTSPDPLIASASRAMPQSWNRYSYTGNNPLKYIDPTGLSWIVGPDGSTFYDPTVTNPAQLRKSTERATELLMAKSER